MNLLSPLKIYNPKWNLKCIEEVDQETIEATAKVVVVPSEFGRSARLDLKTGGVAFIPMDRASQIPINTVINLRDMFVVTLCRNGSADIYRLIEKNLNV